MTACNLRRACCCLFVTCISTISTASAAASEMRQWSAGDGAYTLEAKLVTFNDRSVVVQRADHELVVIPFADLSDEDRKYLESTEATEAADKAADGVQTWTLRDGTKIAGRLVDYAARDVTLQRRRRRTYVNDRPLNNLPEFYQQVVAAIVAEAEKLPRADRRALNEWLRRLDGRPRTFHVEGVVLEAENGDEYGIPFVLFSDEDQALLKPGFDEWRASQDVATSEDHAFLLRSLAAARAHDAEVKREIALMQLKLQAVEAGVTSLWEVTLYPAAGQGGPPLWVVVFARDSRQATLQALEQNPGYVAGPVRRVSRRS